MDASQPGPAMQRFQKSTHIGYIEWHDGIGYDLAALKELSPAETRQVEAWLIARKDADWRDTEGLATLRTPAAIQALKDSLSSKNLDVRLFAARFLMELGVVDSIESIIVNTLPETRIGTGMTFALSLACDYPTPGVIKALFDNALNGPKEIRMFCAGMLLKVYGKSTTEFDFNHSDLLRRFQSPDLSERRSAMQALCAVLQVDWDSI